MTVKSRTRNSNLRSYKDFVGCSNIGGVVRDTTWGSHWRHLAARLSQPGHRDERTPCLIRADLDIYTYRLVKMTLDRSLWNKTANGSGFEGSLGTLRDRG